MTEFTTEQLELVASELNTLLTGEITGDDVVEGEPLVPSTGNSNDVLQKIHEAVDVLISSDKLTDDLCEVIEKTSLGDAEFEIKREDFTGKISIRELFVKRTRIALEMPEKEEPEPEPKKDAIFEDKPAETPEGPISGYDPNNPQPEQEPEDDQEPVDLSKVEPDKLPTKKPPAKKKPTIGDIEIVELVKKLKEAGVQVKRKNYNWERGKSPYSIALELACENPDIKVTELRDLFVEKTGMKLDKTTTPGIRTAYSLMIKVVGYLRREGHMPKKSTRKANK